MNRTQKLKLNSSVSLLARIVTIISGLILPRLILSNYGAETHGLTSSIGQFLSIITFLDMGVGVVVRSALYRPLAKKDDKKVSAALSAAKTYFRKIAYILIIYILILIIFYPLVIDSN
ncbi:MAG TPA: sugar isomerase, partial [Atopostipes sp.]|nr:sugar isomerase [Atopostipes sp.]